MRHRLDLWTDEAGRVVLEAPAGGEIWATLEESDEEGTTVRWHQSVTDVELLRNEESVETGAKPGMEWSLETGDRLLFQGPRTDLEVVAVSVGGDVESEFVDRTREGYDVEPETSRRMWKLHRDLATGAGWERLLEEVSQKATRWPGFEQVDSCAAIIWEGEKRLHQPVRWLDGESTSADPEEMDPLRPGVLTSLLKRRPRIEEGLRRQQLVVRRHNDEIVDILLPIVGDGFEGAFYLLGTPGENFEVGEGWRLVDLVEPAGIELIRRFRSESERRSLEEENRYFRDRERRHYLFKDLVSESEAMREVYDELNERVEDETPIWLTGEAGTGKELLARALHHLGDRREAMMIGIECADFPEELVNFELFGCVASELTGAVAARKGLFELAEEGTVFLDEIDRLSPMVQGKLVRVLTDREVRRVGDAMTRPVSARLIASSHRDLKELTKRGTFRSELYELLAPHRLEVPPLREREADILPLARIFLEKFAERYGAECRRLGDRLQEWLGSYSWPGNVRQLQTVMEAAVLVARDRRVVETGDVVMDNLAGLEK